MSVKWIYEKEEKKKLILSKKAIYTMIILSNSSKSDFFEISNSKTLLIANKQILHLNEFWEIGNVSQ